MKKIENKGSDDYSHKIKDCFLKQDYKGVMFYYQEANDQIRNELAYEFGYSFLRTRREGADIFESCEALGKALEISNYDEKLKDEILQLDYTSREYLYCCTRLLGEANAESVPPEKQSRLIRLGFNCLLLDYYQYPEAFIKFRTDAYVYFLRVNVAAVLIKMIQSESYMKAKKFINSFGSSHDLFLKVIENLFLFLKASKGAESWIKMGIFLNHLKKDSWDSSTEDKRAFIDTKYTECVEAITSYVMKIRNGEEQDLETERLKKYTEHLNKLIDEPLSKVGRKELKHYVVEEANITKDCLELFKKNEFGAIIEQIKKSFPNGLGHATHSVIDYFELSAIKQYEMTGDLDHIADALNYYPESEKLKEILLSG